MRGPRLNADNTLNHEQRALIIRILTGPLARFNLSLGVLSKIGYSADFVDLCELVLSVRSADSRPRWILVLLFHEADTGHRPRVRKQVAYTSRVART